MNENIEEKRPDLQKMAQEQQEERKLPGPKNGIVWIWIGAIGLTIAVILKFFVFDFLTVSGTSMKPALTDGQTIYVNKLAYGLNNFKGDKVLFNWSQPQTGDIVIYLYNNKIVVKRCVAVSGDLLEYSFDTGYTLYVGEKSIPLTELQYLNLKNCDRVPEGYILAIGDNYTESFDSRNYGFVSVGSVLGKILCK